MQETEKRLLRSIDGMKDEIVQLLSDLVKNESVNPPGNTRKAAQILTDKFREFNIAPEVVSVDDDKPNLIARINPGRRPELLFNSHIDTVPPGDLAQWKYDPFAAVVEEGRMYGRGVADAKASIAAMTMAAKAIKRSAIELKGSMVVNPVSDEETGGIKGAKFLRDAGHLTPDFVVIGEQTDNEIAIAEKGIIWFNIKTIGRTAHGSTPWEGVNAIEKMVKLLVNIQEELGSKLKTMSHPLTPPPSINIGTIQGGVKVNVVPDACEVSLDRRLLPEEPPEKAEKELSEIVDRMRRSDPDFKAELKTLLTGSPVNTSPEAEIVRVAQGVNKDLELSSKLVGYAQASDGRFFVEQGIQTIIIGPSDPRVGHTPNEHVRLDDVITTTKIYALITARMLTHVD